MITSKQRAYLRSLSNNLPALYQVGKGGINQNTLKMISEGLEANELVKVHVLENSMLTSRDVCDEIAEKIGAEPVSVVGSKFVIYKESENNPKIILP